MTDTQTAIEIIVNCRLAIEVDGAPFVQLDKSDIDILYAALQSKPVDVGALKKDFYWTSGTGSFPEAKNMNAQARGWNDCIDRLYANGHLNTPQWQPIDTAPRNKNIMLMPIRGIPFSGDIWNCKNRIDIEEDELIRIRCPNGRICTLPITWATHWQDLPPWDSLLPQPPEDTE